MGKRFATVIGVAAAGVMALGAQSAAAAPDVVKYDTKLTITLEGQHTDRGVLWHGGLRSEARKCEEGRRVVLFKERRGPDRKLGSDRNHGVAEWGSWQVWAPTGGRVYAKAKETPVCRADRSRTIVNGDLCFEGPSFCRAERSPTIKRSSHPRSLGAQTATSSTGDPVDSVKPDLQLSGPKKDDPQNDGPICDRGACNVNVKASCGDEECTTRATGKLTNVNKDKLTPEISVVEPGQRFNVGPELAKEAQRREVRKALDNGENVKAKVTVKATDAAGNVATAKRTIKLVK